MVKIVETQCLASLITIGFHNYETQSIASLQRKSVFMTVILLFDNNQNILTARQACLSYFSTIPTPSVGNTEYTSVLSSSELEKYAIFDQKVSPPLDFIALLIGPYLPFKRLATTKSSYNSPKLGKYQSKPIERHHPRAGNSSNPSCLIAASQ